MKRIFILFFFSLFFSNANAQYWEEVTNIPTPYNAGYYLDLYLLPTDHNYIWICGFDGFIIRSTDNGATWRGSQLPNPAYHIESIQFVNKLIGYTSGVEGIYKSTDGGASWFDITPSSMEFYWGSYFLNENVGVLLGGGCDGLQRFYKTTNGGVSWSFSTKTVPNTGLTDPILYPSGLGYAVSSGRIWITNDTGSTWQIFANSGSEIWQEELSILGNSIVVPTSGVTCDGGENTGGMRFSTNMGSTWKEFQTGYSMFGAILVSESEAWACGYNRSVYYTSDAGTTWQMRDCGIKNVHLDDITFTSPTDGWVVGEGVYRMKPTKITANRDTIDFGNVCVNDSHLDTLQIQNLSFFPADLTVQKSLDFDNVFSIEQPSFQSQISNCSNTNIIVKFTPKDKKIFEAKLIINANSQDGITHFSKEIVLIGEGLQSTVKPTQDLITLNPVRCGDTIISNLTWSSDVPSDAILDFVPISYANNQISFITKLPLIISPSGTTTQFRTHLLDTGWVTCKFRFTLSPCNSDTVITVKAYGISPIITSIDSLHLTLHCSGSIIDTIPIWNTGNAPLDISNISFSNHIGNIQILGWTSQKQLPITIQNKQSDSLIIQYSSNKIGKEVIYLSIDNNDRTLARGSKQPYSIMLVFTTESEDISVKNQIIDFGNVCINNKIDTAISLKNIGNIAAYLSVIKNSQPPYNLEFLNPNIQADESENILISFLPTQRGLFFDTLIIKTGDCKEITLYLKGYGIESLLATKPSSIKDILILNQTKYQSIKLTNTGNIPLDIVNYSFNPPLTNITADLQPILTQTLDTNQSILFNLGLTANQIGVYSGEICFEAQGLCPLNICIPIELNSVARSVSVDNAVDFPTIYCSGKLYDTLWIRNFGELPDTITQISISGDNSFALVQSPQLPAFINARDSMAIILLFQPINEGEFTATLHLETVQPLGQTFDIPITASFYRSIITSNLTKLDFGILERCDEPITKQFIIYNNGMADEALIVIEKQFANYFSIDNSDNIIVKGKDSVVISITFYPDIAKNEGVYSGKILWANTLCPDTTIIEFTAQIIEPHLSYSKTDINFYSVWKDDIKYDTINITNNSTIARQIQIIKFPDDNDFQITAIENNSTLDFPILIQPSSSILLVVSFKATNEGNFNDDFYIEEKSICVDTLLFNLQSNVPEEQYSAKVFIDNYIVKYGDTLTFYIELSDDLPRIQAEQISFDIEFDTYLYFPLEVMVRNENLDSYTSINFNKKIRNIDAVIDSTYAHYLLNNSGKIIAIKGIALYSSPTQTPLIISDFQVRTSKELLLTEQDGNLIVLDICEPIAQHRLVLTNAPYVELPNQFIENDKLTLDCYNLSEDIKMIISNSYGQKLKESILPKGSNSLTFNIKDLTSGVYFIYFNKSDALGNFKFIIVK